jgi:hypothetical protein
MMKSKRTLAYWCINVGIVGWSLLEYAMGAQPWVVAASALFSLCLLNGIAWFVSRRAGSSGDDASGSSRLEHSRRRPIAFWCGIILIGLGAIPFGLGTWYKISGVGSLDGLPLLDAVVAVAFGTFLATRYRRT